MRKDLLNEKNITKVLLGSLLGSSLLFGVRSQLETKANYQYTVLNELNVRSQNATSVDSRLNELSMYQNNNGLKTIVIDAGHGGHDPGAINYKTGQEEAPLNLDIALRVKRLLELKGYKVVMTRSMHGQYIDLLDRTLVASNNGNCELYLSIHSNASGTHEANGFESWYKTNDYTSYQIGNDIANEVCGLTNQTNRGSKNKKLYIDYSNKPAVLVECGFIDNDSDLMVLTTKQDDIAVGIVKGILKNL